MLQISRGDVRKHTQKRCGFGKIAVQFSGQALFQQHRRQEPGVGVVLCLVHNQTPRDVVPPPLAVLSGVAGRETVCGIVAEFLGQQGWLANFTSAPFPRRIALQQVLHVFPHLGINQRGMRAVTDLFLVSDPSRMD